MNVISVHSKNHGSITLPWFTISLASILAGLFAIHGPMPESLLWHRIGFEQQELWRYLTGHFVHTDIRHLLWNVTALIILSGVLEAVYGFNGIWQTGLIMIASTIISASIHWFRPDLYWYAGFSGILNAYFTVFLWTIWLQYRHPTTVVVAIGLIIKIATETLVGDSLIGAGSFAIVPIAHAAGVAAGLMIIAYSVFCNLKLIQITPFAQNQGSQAPGKYSK